MSSSLLICYNELFVKTRAILADHASWDTFSLGYMNYLAGQRYCYGGFVDDQESMAIDLDLGTGNTLSLNYMIVAGLGYLNDKTGMGLRIQTSADNSTYTNAIGRTSAFESCTLIGDSTDFLFKQGLNDTIGSLPTTARRWFRILGAVTTGHRWIFSKIYAGTMFDMGKDPDGYALQNIIGSPHGFRFPTGNIAFSKLQYPLLRVELVWRGITDAKVEEFFTYIVERPESNFVFLHTVSQHAVLSNKQLMHAELIGAECKHRKIQQNYNEVRAVFIEARG